MKKLKRLKKILELVDEYTKEIKSELEKAKREHQKLILESNSKLISEIAKGEGLDELDLIEKYLKKSKTKVAKNVSEESSEKLDDELLSHITVDGKDYFYEDKSNGAVYDTDNNKVGSFKCGTIKFSSN